MRCLIVIPARLKATRLPDKPLAMIGDAPMIVQVWRRAMEAGIGDVVVACDGPEIADAVEKAGGRAIVTDPNHPSGSDRIWEAVCKMYSSSPCGRRPGRGGVTSGDELPYSPPHHPNPLPQGERGYDVIINLQGDVPTLEPRLLKELLKPLANKAVDIATLAAEIQSEEEHTNSSVVKIALGENGRALYFSRAAIPANEGPRYHHIGVYAYRLAALEKFVSLPPSPLEKREKLEQLRALEAGMRIDAVVVDTVPLGVDTPADLERARQILGQA